MERKIALVTGGSKGLGEEIVQSLAAAGYDVAFTYKSDERAAAHVCNDVEKKGRKAMALKADAREFARAGEVVKEVLDAWGSIDALICNAGFSRPALLWEITEQDWDDVMDVCLKGTFNYMRAVAPHFIAKNSGKIVSIGSINGLRARRNTASYNAAKAGLTGLIKAAAIEMGEFNINVNLIAPGFIETPSQKNTPDSMRELVLSECAIKRLGQPEDIAPVVVFLCSDGARHITGQVIKVDAGQYI